MQFSQKVAIVGNSGSGKSTLAEKIHSQTGAPILQLDNITWDRKQIQKRREISDSLDALKQFTDSHSPSWIVEGCYGELIESLFSLRPMLIFLDPGEAVCLKHCQNRGWERHKYPSKDEQDKYLPFLLSWVSEYYRREGPMSYQFHRALYDRYSGPKILFDDVALVEALGAR